MTHVPKERGFGAVELRQFLGAFPLRFVRPNAREPRCDLTREKFEVPDIGSIQRTKWIDAGDEKPGRGLRARLTDRHNNGLARRLVPRTRGHRGKTRIEVLDDEECLAIKDWGGGPDR